VPAVLLLVMFIQLGSTAGTGGPIIFKLAQNLMVTGG
jgi:hypothetical protein